jgi:hypothetical protein
MSCIVYSKSKNIPIGIWSRIKSSPLALENLNSCFKCNVYDLITNFGNITTENQYVGSQGIGTFIKVDGNIFIITCFHVVGLFNMEIYACVGSQITNSCTSTCTRIKLDIFRTVPEFDLAILKLVNKSDEDKLVNHYDEIELNTKISLLMSNNNIKLNLLTQKNDVMENKIKSIFVDVTNVENTNEDFIGHIIPKLPLIIFKCNHEFENDNIDGISGSLLMLDSVPVGMVMSFVRDRGVFQAIPMILIKLIINKIITSKKVNTEIKGYNIPTKNARVGYSNGYQKDVRLVCDESAYYKTETKKDFLFGKNDVILEVGGKSIENGSVNFEEIGCSVDFDFYLMISCFLNDSECCDFKLIKYKDLKTEKVTNISVYGKLLNELYNVNIFNSHEYVYWKGYIFCELSEELIDDIECLESKHVVGYIFEQLKMGNCSKKYVVLIDTLNSENPYVKDIFFEKSFQEQCCIYMYILEKVGNKKINGLKDLEKFVDVGSKQNNKKLTLYYQKDDEIIKNLFI